MKAKKKHLQDNSNKIQNLPKEHDGHEEPNTATNPRNNRFLARLRKTWARITGCLRSHNSIQEERSAKELPGPSKINTEDSKDLHIQYKERVDEEQNEVKVLDNKVIDAETKIKEDKVQEASNISRDLHIQYKEREDEVQNEVKVLENKVEGAETKIKKDEVQEASNISRDLHIQYKEREDEVQNEVKVLDNKVVDAETNIKKDEVQEASNISRDLHIQYKEREDEVQNEVEVLENKVEGAETNIKEDKVQEASNISRGLHIQYKEREDEVQNEVKVLENKVEGAEAKIKEDEVQEASNISRGKEKEDNNVEDTNISMNVPLRLKSFTFHQTLGKGSYGEVYSATDKIYKRSVAIKALDKEYFTEKDHNFVERQILEVAHESPYLVHGLAAFQTPRSLYLVMDLASRGDLLKFMYKKRSLDHATIKFIIAEVICGIQFLHKHHIIHHDLKPANILLSKDGHIKVTDFGLSIMGVHETTEEHFGGTAIYMAPELVRREAHGRGVDYYAIGVILYWMYTLKNPFPLHGTIVYPEFMTPETVNIIQGLLHKDQHCRLGVHGDIRSHPYFSDINWEDMEAMRVQPPAIMTADPVDLNMRRTLKYREKANKRSKDHTFFTEFDFLCPEWAQQYNVIQPTDRPSLMATWFPWRPIKKRE